MDYPRLMRSHKLDRLRGKLATELESQELEESYGVAGNADNGQGHEQESLSDPIEVRRCGRTDGRKWRCSRPAVPDRRYCKRHVYLVKYRSRKAELDKNSSCGVGNADNGQEQEQEQENLSDPVDVAPSQRCSRTDGKKWRCSRPAVPDQRYCKRHIHLKYRFKKPALDSPFKGTDVLEKKEYAVKSRTRCMEAESRCREAESRCMEAETRCREAENKCREAEEILKSCGRRKLLFSEDALEELRGQPLSGQVFDDEMMEECSFCLERFTSEGWYTLGSCGHRYHLQCLMLHSLCYKSCIVCNVEFPREFYKTICNDRFIPNDD